MIKNRIIISCIWIFMIIILLASYVSAQEIIPPNCGGDICTDICQDTGESDPEKDTWNFYCTGPGDQITECGGDENWWKCCCEVVGPEQCAEIWDVPFDLETITAKCEGEIELESPEPTLIDSIIRCYPEEKYVPINYNAVYAEINSVKVNGEEQLLEGQTISIKGDLSEGGNYYKYYAAKRFACATPQNPEGEGDEEIYCEVEIDVPVYNENVKILILDSDFSSTPCIITKEEEEKDLCLNGEKSEINFKENIVKVSNNEEKTIDITCDQNIMIRPFLKTTSQRWTEVCERPAVALIQEYKTGTQENLRTIFDWQRVDVDEWENAYVLNREQCKLEEKMNSLEAAYRDTELTWEMAQNRENCNFEPVNDRCYWIEAKKGTTLKIKVADATEDSFIEVAYRNCDCYCNEEEGMSCDYEADSCSPPQLRDLECPDLLTIDCDKTGDWPYMPDGLPSCGGRGGGYSGVEDVDTTGWIDLGDPYDTNLCLGPGPEPSYCSRTYCSIRRDTEKETTCYGDDIVKQRYWGSCRGEADCYPGYISLTGQECTGKPEEANCVFGCVWDNECLDCTGRPDTACYDGKIPCHEWTGEPSCECLPVVECEEGQTLNEETCTCESPEEESEEPVE